MPKPCSLGRQPGSTEPSPVLGAVDSSRSPRPGEEIRVHNRQDSLNRDKSEDRQIVVAGSKWKKEPHQVARGGSEHCDYEYVPPRPDPLCAHRATALVRSNASCLREKRTARSV